MCGRHRVWWKQRQAGPRDRSLSSLSKVYASAPPTHPPHTWIDAPRGVSYLATVMTSPLPSARPNTPCTRPFPNVFFPIRTARQLSRRAEAKISDALAERPSVHTTRGSACVCFVYTTPLP